MKNENTENVENQPVPKDPDASGNSEKKPAKPKKGKKEVNAVQLPVLVEFTYTISVLFLMALALTIIVISLLKGASLLTLVLRASVTIFVMGGLLMLISSQVSSGLLFSSQVELDEHEKAQSEEINNSADSAELEDHDKAEAS